MTITGAEADTVFTEDLPYLVNLVKNSESWSYRIPEVSQTEFNSPIMTVNLGQLEGVVSYNEALQELSIDDLAEPSVPTGMFEIKIIIESGS